MEKKEEVKYTFDDILREKLQLHLSKMKHLENGNLHKMVINLVEKPLLKLVLQETQGNQLQAANILGLSRGTLRKKIKDLKINV